MKRIAGMIVLFLGVLASQAFAQSFKVFPHLTNGNGWSSEFFFANQGLVDALNVQIIFYDNESIPLVVATSEGTASSISFDLIAGATKMIKTLPSDSYQEGYAIVVYPMASAPIRATEVYRYESGGVVSVEVGVPLQEISNNYSFPVEMDSANGILTALALANPLTRDQTAILNLITIEGTIQATAKVPLPTGHHTALYLNESDVFPGLDNFVGTVSVSSNIGIGALAIRQDKQAFGGISTDYGPILKPFSLSMPETPLPEPNDAPVDAPRYSSSTLLTGTISADGDLDALRFRANAGDVFSILCEKVPGAGNDLDPVLQVYYDGPTGPIIIAQNDNNGLSPSLTPSKDSFLQMELILAGNYYVLLQDYNGKGGIAFNYRLHLRVP